MTLNTFLLLFLWLYLTCWEDISWKHRSATPVCCASLRMSEVLSRGRGILQNFLGNKVFSLCPEGPKKTLSLTESSVQRGRMSFYLTTSRISPIQVLRGITGWFFSSWMPWGKLVEKISPFEPWNEQHGHFTAVLSCENHWNTWCNWKKIGPKPKESQRDRLRWILFMISRDNTMAEVRLVLFSLDA